MDSTENSEEPVSFGLCAGDGVFTSWLQDGLAYDTETFRFATVPLAGSLHPNDGADFRSGGGER